MSVMISETDNKTLQTEIKSNGQYLNADPGEQKIKSGESSDLHYSTFKYDQEIAKDRSKTIDMLNDLEHRYKTGTKTRTSKIVDLFEASNKKFNSKQQKEIKKRASVLIKNTTGGDKEIQKDTIANIFGVKQV